MSYESLKLTKTFSFMSPNDSAVANLEAEVEALEADSEAEKDTTDWKAKYEETTGRLKRAETSLERLKVNRKAEALVEKKSNELDETHLAYLELKGISEDDDIKVIERHINRTGESVREALKDDYIISKLAANKEKREVKDATPSSTKRSGSGQSNDVASALAKFEQTGELPQDFKLASAVTNAVIDKANKNKPSWH